MLLAVADGVSQIEDFGIDPSELPHELLQACNELALDQLFPEMLERDSHHDPYLGPIPMMRRAFEATESLGSTTVLLAILDNSSKIHGKLHPMIAVMSIGDCEILILRRVAGAQSRLEAVFHTEMQRIDGNAQAPLQVARVDERVDPDFDERITYDVIERGSAVHCMSAYEGDIIVQGSDGLFDNLFIDEIVDFCNEYFHPPRPGQRFIPEQQSVLDQLARRIVSECHKKTERGRTGELRDAPIGKGGKVDDTCCVVGQVIEWSEQHSEVWKRVQRHRMAKHSGAFCNLGGMSQCDRADDGSGSELGSEFASSEYGSEYGQDGGNRGSVFQRISSDWFGCKLSKSNRRGGS
jgi:serine/threonine protein phosphatase PrpC